MTKAGLCTRWAERFGRYDRPTSRALYEARRRPVSPSNYALGGSVLRSNYMWCCT